MRVPTLPVRARWALWCAGLVTATGVMVVVIVLSMTSALLRDRNDELMEREPPVPQGQAQSEPALGAGPGAAPGRGPGAAPDAGPGQPPGAGQPPIDQQRATDRARGEIANDVFDDMRTYGIAIVIALAVASLGVGWLVAGRMVKPLRRITDVAGAVAGGRFGQRIGMQGPHDELRQLADQFDDMLDRLDAAFAAQRSFVADASHELRTPLTVMRAEIDVALDDPDASPEELREALDQTSFALARTTRLVESLLALSRSEVLVHVEDHDLATSVDRSVAVHLAGRDGVSVRSDHAVARGDGVLIDRIVDNLVENAARYTPAGGRIDIATRVDDGAAVVRVANDGPMLDAAEVSDSFTRFHRRDGRHNPYRGAGLGLAIVESSVRTHGGTISAAARPVGGMEVEVRLPAASAS